jgi:hypothetical protein
MWADFYGIPYFPIFNEIPSDNSGRYVKLPSWSNVYLDVLVYKRRLRVIIEIFLKEANLRGLTSGKNVFCHI